MSRTCVHEAILDLLRGDERSVGDLVERLDLSQPGVSKHLKVLREAGLVASRPAGERRLYALRSQPLTELDAWLEPYRVLWSNRLDPSNDTWRRTRDRRHP